MVRRTVALDSFDDQAVLNKARMVVDRVPRNIISRTAAFLLLQDSRSSYAIEGEAPRHSRMERWGRVIGQAGTIPVTVAELQRLQEIVIGRSRFVTPGLRSEGGFIGEHDRETGTPIPEHISARPDDLPSLMEGLTTYVETTAQELPALVAATCAAFGFVYIHPFSDGNGRIHRYLVHHVLARRGFGGPGLVFPVSALFLTRIEEYQYVLQSWSHRILPLISWDETTDHNVRVTNNTADSCRFPDLTPHTEFVASCIVDMPHTTINRLFRFLDSNDGTFPERRRRREFSELTDPEVVGIQALYASATQNAAGLESVGRRTGPGSSKFTVRDRARMAAQYTRYRSDSVACPRSR